jgi:hypothetical protein
VSPIGQLVEQPYWGCLKCDRLSMLINVWLLEHNIRLYVSHLHDPPQYSLPQQVRCCYGELVA